jgi:hypothetical protein
VTREPTTYPVQRLETFLGRDITMAATGADANELKAWRIEDCDVPNVVLCRADAALHAGRIVASCYDQDAAREWMSMPHSALEARSPAAFIGRATSDRELDRPVECARRYISHTTDTYRYSSTDPPARRRVSD